MRDRDAAPPPGVRVLTATDLSAVVAVHRRAFAGSALTALGPGAVRRYYAWLLDPSHDAHALGSLDADGALAAFCFGGVFRGATSGFLARHRLYLAGSALVRPWLAVHPVVRQRARFALQVMRRGTAPRPTGPGPAPWEPAAGRSSVVPSAAPAGPRFGILAIATDPGAARGGHGARLMRAMEALANAERFAAMRLTVSPDNTGAHKFYERLGWERVLPRDGGPWGGLMEKTLVPARPAAT